MAIYSKPEDGQASEAGAAAALGPARAEPAPKVAPGIEQKKGFLYNGATVAGATTTGATAAAACATSGAATGRAPRRPALLDL